MSWCLAPLRCLVRPREGTDEERNAPPPGAQRKEKATADASSPILRSAEAGSSQDAILNGAAPGPKPHLVQPSASPPAPAPPREAAIDMRVAFQPIGPASMAQGPAINAVAAERLQPPGSVVPLSLPSTLPFPPTNIPVATAAGAAAATATLTASAAASASADGPVPLSHPDSSTPSPCMLNGARPVAVSVKDGLTTQDPQATPFTFTVPLASMVDAAALAVATVARVNPMPSRSFTYRHAGASSSAATGPHSRPPSTPVTGKHVSGNVVPVFVADMLPTQAIMDDSSTVSISSSEDNEDGLPSLTTGGLEDDGPFGPQGACPGAGSGPGGGGGGGGPGGQGAGVGSALRPTSRSQQRHNAEEAAFIRGTLAALKQATLAGFEDLSEGEVLPGLPRVWTTQNSQRGVGGAIVAAAAAAAAASGGGGGGAAAGAGGAASGSATIGPISYGSADASANMSLNPVVHEANLAVLFNSGAITGSSTGGSGGGAPVRTLLAVAVNNNLAALSAAGCPTFTSASTGASACAAVHGVLHSRRTSGRGSNGSDRLSFSDRSSNAVGSIQVGGFDANASKCDGSITGRYGSGGDGGGGQWGSGGAVGGDGSVGRRLLAASQPSPGHSARPTPPVVQTAVQPAVHYADVLQQIFARAMAAQQQLRQQQQLAQQHGQRRHDLHDPSHHHHHQKRPPPPPQQQQQDSQPRPLVNVAAHFQQHAPPQQQPLPLPPGLHPQHRHRQEQQRHQNPEHLVRLSDALRQELSRVRHPAQHPQQQNGPGSSPHGRQAEAPRPDPGSQHEAPPPPPPPPQQGREHTDASCLDAAEGPAGSAPGSSVAATAGTESAVCNQLPWRLSSSGLAVSRDLRGGLTGALTEAGPDLAAAAATTAEAAPGTPPASMPQLQPQQLHPLQPQPLLLSQQQLQQQQQQQQQQQLQLQLQLHLQQQEQHRNGAERSSDASAPLERLPGAGTAPAVAHSNGCSGTEAVGGDSQAMIATLGRSPQHVDGGGATCWQLPSTSVDGGSGDSDRGVRQDDGEGEGADGGDGKMTGTLSTALESGEASTSYSLTAALPAAATAPEAEVAAFAQQLGDEHREVLAQLVREKWSPFSFPLLSAPPVAPPSLASPSGGDAAAAPAAPGPSICLHGSPFAAAGSVVFLSYGLSPPGLPYAPHGASDDKGGTALDTAAAVSGPQLVAIHSCRTAATESASIAPSHLGSPQSNCGWAHVGAAARRSHDSGSDRRSGSQILSAAIMMYGGGGGGSGMIRADSGVSCLTKSLPLPSHTRGGGGDEGSGGGGGGDESSGGQGPGPAGAGAVGTGPLVSGLARPPEAWGPHPTSRFTPQAQRSPHPPQDQQQLQQQQPQQPDYHHGHDRHHDHQLQQPQQPQQPQQQMLGLGLGPHAGTHAAPQRRLLPPQSLPGTQRVLQSLEPCSDWLYDDPYPVRLQRPPTAHPDPVLPGAAGPCAPAPAPAPAPGSTPGPACLRAFSCGASGIPPPYATAPAGAIDVVGGDPRHGHPLAPPSFSGPPAAAALTSEASASTWAPIPTAVPELSGSDMHVVKSLVERKWSPFFDLAASLGPPAILLPPPPPPPPPALLAASLDAPSPLQPPPQPLPQPHAGVGSGRRVLAGLGPAPADVLALAADPIVHMGDVSPQSPPWALGGGAADGPGSGTRSAWQQQEKQQAATPSLPALLQLPAAQPCSAPGDPVGGRFAAAAAAARQGLLAAGAAAEAGGSPIPAGGGGEAHPNLRAPV